MKKKLLIFLSIAVSFIIAVFGACTIVDENKDADAINIAVNQYGYEKVYFACVGSRHSVLLKENATKYIIYVLGERDGEEKILIVPALKDKQSYEIEWPFNESFKSIVTKVNQAVGEELWDESNFENIEFLDNGFELFSIDTSLMDVEFAIMFGKCCVYQSNGDIVIDCDE